MSEPDETFPSDRRADSVPVKPTRQESTMTVQTFIVTTENRTIRPGDHVLVTARDGTFHVNTASDDYPEDAMDGNVIVSIAAVSADLSEQTRNERTMT